MEKKFYIRFFTNKEDGVPINSHALMERSDLMLRTFQEADADQMVIEWMKDYPNGKVDFVWL